MYMYIIHVHVPVCSNAGRLVMQCKQFLYVWLQGCVECWDPRSQARAGELAVQPTASS